MNNTFSFKVTAFVNGQITWMCDCVHEYTTREDAIRGARYEAEYWGFLRKDSRLEKTEDGAVLYFTDNNENRCRNEYKVNA